MYNWLPTRAVPSCSMCSVFTSNAHRIGSSPLWPVETAYTFPWGVSAVAARMPGLSATGSGGLPEAGSNRSSFPTRMPDCPGKQ